MPPTKKATNRVRKAANGYQLPQQMPIGEIVSSAAQRKKWRLDKPIGSGGFGEIYACRQIEPVDDHMFALKIEPYLNGPLFVEMNFYIRVAQPATVDAYRVKNRDLLTSSGHLGMPVFRGSGSHVHQNEKYRFLVMDQYGKDLSSIVDVTKESMKPVTAYNVAMQVIDVYQFLHSADYVHNDVKASNLLFACPQVRSQPSSTKSGSKRSSRGQSGMTGGDVGAVDCQGDIYLVDFGLASIYRRDGVHFPCKADVRRAHDGTIEYTSRDAHIGVHARRSDLEILAFNLVHWMSGTLPWMSVLSDAQEVHKQKKMHMNDVTKFLKACFKRQPVPDELAEFLMYINRLEFDAAPNYDRCKAIFRNGLSIRGLPLDGKIRLADPVKQSRLDHPTYSRRSRQKSAGVENDPNQSNGAHSFVADDVAKPSTKIGKRSKQHDRKSSGHSDSWSGGISSPPKRRHLKRQSHGLSLDIANGSSCLKLGAVHVTDAVGTRSSSAVSEQADWNWESVLGSNPEQLMRRTLTDSAEVRYTEDDSWGLVTDDGDLLVSTSCSRNAILEAQRRQADKRLQEATMANPTSEMIRLSKQIVDREQTRQSLKSWADQLAHLTAGSASRKLCPTSDQWSQGGKQGPSVAGNHFQGMSVTPAMARILDKRKSRKTKSMSTADQNCSPATDSATTPTKISDALRSVVTDNSDGPGSQSSPSSQERSLMRLLRFEAVSIEDQRRAIAKFETNRHRRRLRRSDGPQDGAGQTAPLFKVPPAIRLISPMTSD